MVVVPALGVGGFVVFLIGYVAMYLTLEKVVQKKRKLEWLDDRTEKLIGIASLLGGGIAFALLMLVLTGKPEWRNGIIATLVLLGLGFGWLTFLLSASSEQTHPTTKYRPASFTYKQSPPREEYKTINPITTPLPIKEDYYRTLLAKTRYDKNLTDRLIDEERKHMPYASFDDICKSAIAKLERDNR